MLVLQLQDTYTVWVRVATFWANIYDFELTIVSFLFVIFKCINKKNRHTHFTLGHIALCLPTNYHPGEKVGTCLSLISIRALQVERTGEDLGVPG